MNLFAQMHHRFVHNRRVSILNNHLSELIPDNSQILDVGSGDGLIPHLIMQQRPDITIEGIDIGCRKNVHIPIKIFDGQKIPFPNSSFDIVMFIDVLHHTEDPMILLHESIRVARKFVLIKDHIMSGFISGAILRFMDWVGNAHHGVPLPYNYWSQPQWNESFRLLNITIDESRNDLRLYPPGLDRIFGKSLHFAARLKLDVPADNRL